MLEAVERPCDRGRRTDLRLHDDEVLGDHRPSAELVEQAVEDLPRVDPALPVRQDVAEPAERVARLLEAQLANVARDGRLGDAAARRLERVEELLLRPEPLALDETGHQPLPLRLRQL